MVGWNDSIEREREREGEGRGVGEIAKGDNFEIGMGLNTMEI